MTHVMKSHPSLGGRGATFLVVVENLVQHVNIMRTHGRTLPPRALQGLVDTFKTCVGALESIDFHFTPKFHTWAHIVVDARVKGNPWLAATYLDESYNNTLKNAASGCHARTFERRLFRRM